LGDILEHVKDPNIVLQEAKRITKDRIVITVPNENEFPEHLRKPIPEPVDKQNEINSTLKHPSEYATCIENIWESDFPHNPHVRRYNDEEIIELMDSIGLKYIIMKLLYEVNGEDLVTYGIIMWKD